MLLHGLQRAGLELLLVEHIRGFLIGELTERVFHLQLAPRSAVTAEILEHPLQLARHLLHARRCHDLDADGYRLQIDLDLAVVQVALAQHLAEFLARVGALCRRCFGVETDTLRSPWQQCVEYPLLGRVLGAMSHLRHLLFARHLDGDIDQVADDAVHLAADVADLGELRRLDLDERCPGEPRETARDLGLADAGRTDHQDVLRGDLAAQRFVDLHAAPAVAQCDGDRALGLVLADDVLVQFLDDLSGGHL